MDVEYEWMLNDDVDSLINVVFNCKKELTKMCFSKYSSAKITEFEVCASPKICELMMTHTSSKPAHPDIAQTSWMLCVGSFDSFNLFNYKTIDDKNIRVFIKFDVGEGIAKNWYGNIKVHH